MEAAGVLALRFAQARRPFGRRLRIASQCSSNPERGFSSGYLTNK